MEDQVVSNQVNGPRENQGKKTIWIILMAVIALILAGGAYFFLNREAVDTTSDSASTQDTADNSPTNEKKSWQEGEVAIAGAFADAEVVDLGDGRYRMYYSIEPEVEGNQLEMYSALSTDGVSWTIEAGDRKTKATFPDIITLADGSLRMYFQNERVIKSATSVDGLVFTDEAGVRIDKQELGYAIDSVGSQSTMKLSDGSYLMVYAGTQENIKYAPNVPNNKIANFFYATSKDGIVWEKKGLALNSANSILEGWVDGAELVDFDGSTRLYFWGYKGIYYISYTEGEFSTEPVFDFTNETDTSRAYPANGPGDPSLVKVKDQWFMYYGQHTKGIYYTILR